MLVALTVFRGGTANGRLRPQRRYEWRQHGHGAGKCHERFMLMLDRLCLDGEATLRREVGWGWAALRHEMDTLDVTIRHYPHTGQPIVTARAGKGVRLNLKTGPTMRPS